MQKMPSFYVNVVFWLYIDKDVIYEAKLLGSRRGSEESMDTDGTKSTLQKYRRPRKRIRGVGTWPKCRWKQRWQ